MKVVWAADLVKKLEETGTPPDKLACVRDAMAARWEATTDLAAGDPARHVAADEAVGMLESKYGADHGTVKKAKEIRDTGGYAPPPAPVHPAELIPPPPAGVVPAKKAEAGDPPGETPVAKKKGKKGKKDAPAMPPGETPGVVELSADVPAVGPVPVE